MSKIEKLQKEIRLSDWELDEIIDWSKRDRYDQNGKLICKAKIDRIGVFADKIDELIDEVNRLQSFCHVHAYNKSLNRPNPHLGLLKNIDPIHDSPYFKEPGEAYKVLRPNEEVSNEQDN